MSLRSTIVLILSGVIALYAACVYGIQQLVILPGFVALEEEGADRDLARASEAIQNEIAHLDAFCRDWAGWDDTYEFVLDGNEAYAAANLNESTFESRNFDLAYYCDTSGRIVTGEIRDPLEQVPIELAGFPKSPWPLEHPLFANRDGGRSTSGMWVTERGPLLLSSQPILTSTRSGPMRGWLVMGLFLDPGALERLAAQTRVDLAAWPVGAPELPDAARAALAQLGAETPIVRTPASDDLLQVYGVFRDYLGEPALLLRADVPRGVMARGSSVLRFALFTTLAAALVLLLVLLVLLQRSVVAPIAKLTAHAVAIGRNDDLSSKLALQRRDEIGVLSREIDRMVDLLARSRGLLLDSARLGGMSEVATSVLHNVGNALNSVNVSASLVEGALASPSAADLERVVDVLFAHEADLGQYLAHDERGRHLPAFLAALAKSLGEERTSAKEELRSLSKGLEHIRSLVDAQQACARASGVLEKVSPGEHLEAALAMTSAQEDARELEIVREYEELPALPLHRHKVLEILVNLIRNARQSLGESGRSDPRLVLRMSQPAPGRLRYQVEDNGVGIPPENLVRIFQHGFTTKPGGHGFGLHSSANSAREMGGAIEAASDGVGRGATFTLELPVAAPVLQPA